jgi:hypothetical protein
VTWWLLVASVKLVTSKEMTNLPLNEK